MSQTVLQLELLIILGGVFALLDGAPPKRAVDERRPHVRAAGALTAGRKRSSLRNNPDSGLLPISLVVTSDAGGAFFGRNWW